MKIVYIIPGSGGNFYCQNCLRDNILADAMRNAGHEVVIVPMYLPMFSDSGETTEDAPIFYGAVNLYLKYRYPIFRKLPNWVLRVLDSPLLLNLAARNAGSTRAAGLEGMTLDILNGEAGTLADELQKLVQWLSDAEKPDIVHISNSLLLGIAGEIKNKLDVPIVCSLQDEHQWVDTMEKPFVDQVWDGMAEKVKDVDIFLAVSRYYGDRMRQKLHITEDKMRIVHIGIRTEDYPERENLPSPPAIGYLSKISESLGFGILMEAFIKLKSTEKYHDLRLYASGGVTKENTQYVKCWQKRIAEMGFASDFIIEPEFDRQGRVKLLQKISLLSVPVPGGEAFGTYLLEAMASGVPVVQPDEGGFAEIINKAGGGVAYQPNDAETLAATIDQLLLDPEELQRLSKHGRLQTRKHFDISNFVTDTLNVYEDISITKHTNKKNKK